jgi:23S rRNA (guanosine2251-2'-O)-methyltransferase
VSPFRERNDRKPRRIKAPSGLQERAADKPQHKPRPRFHPKREDPDGWVWGRHAAEAAILNVSREAPLRALASPASARDVESWLGKARRNVRVEVMEPHDIGRMLPQGAAHQGIALRLPALEGVGLDELAEPAKGVIVMLDQVTDPQNVGAVFRSAAAFGARGVILQDRNAPQLAGALAKASAGAIDRLPCARVVNLSRALEELEERGWRAVGLDGTAEESLHEALDGRPTVLVLGSEGEGLRRLVAEHCDVLARIPMPGGFESLNVSNACAIALYEASRRLGTGSK